MGLRGLNTGLFFQHLSSILSIWICRNLELFWFLLSYFGKDHWDILQKTLELISFHQKFLSPWVIFPLFLQKSANIWSYFPKWLELFSKPWVIFAQKSMSYFWNVEKISLIYAYALQTSLSNFIRLEENGSAYSIDTPGFSAEAQWVRTLSTVGVFVHAYTW